MSDANRANRLDRAIADLLGQAPEVEAAAVVSFDGLPMASALPITMDEDRVAAMSAALLSLGERAAEGLGRGALSQVYIEGEHGTVFLASADDEAVLVAVASKGAKVGMVLYEVRRAAAVVAEVLRTQPVTTTEPIAEAVQYAEPVADPVQFSQTMQYAEAIAAPVSAAVGAPLSAPVAPVAPVETWGAPAQPAPAAPAPPVDTFASIYNTPNPLEDPLETTSFQPPAPEPTWPSYLPETTPDSSTTTEQTPWT